MLSISDLVLLFLVRERGGCGITFWERDVRPLIERMITGKEKKELEILLPTQPGK